MKIGSRDIQWDNIDQVLRDKARRHKSKVFLDIDGVQLSYVQLDELTLTIAENLISRGIGKGDRVASLMFNASEQVLGWLGTTRMGAIWTPLNASLTGDDLEYALRDSGATVLIVDADNRQKLDTLNKDILEQTSVYVTGGPVKAPYHAFSDLLIRRTATIELPSARPGDAAVILYTGGTTGLPKGVVIPQFAFILAGLRYGEVYAARAEERHFTTMPLFHAAAMQWGIMGPLINDMTSVIDRRFSATTYWKRVRETRANIIDPFGSIMTLICQQSQSDADRDHEVRVAAGATHQLPPNIPEQFTARFGVPLVEFYGLSEAGGMLTSNRLGDQEPGSNGKTYGWVDIRIADKNDLPLPPGEIGEILLRPTFPHMFMLGYHGNPEKTLEVFRNLWLHTGDLGRIDEQGNLFFLGRGVYTIRRRGENVSPYEIEQILSQYPGIAEICVVGVLSEIGEEDIKAFIIPTDQSSALDPIAISEWCMTRMAPFKVPRFFEFVDDFPRSITKREVQRSTLKMMPNDNAWDREKAMGRLSSQA